MGEDKRAEVVDELEAVLELTKHMEALADATFDATDIVVIGFVVGRKNQQLFSGSVDMLIACGLMLTLIRELSKEADVLTGEELTQLKAMSEKFRVKGEKIG